MPVANSARIYNGTNTSATLLGGPLGGTMAANEDFTRRMTKVEALHLKVGELQNGQTSLALTLACLSTNKAVHTLRLAGDQIDIKLLQQYDEVLRRAVTAALECDVIDDAWEQSCRPLDQGGLGIHLDSEVAMPAVLASRFTASPIVEALGAEMEKAGYSAQPVTAEHLRRTRQAEASLAHTLRESPGLQAGFTRLCVQLRRAAEAKWFQYCGAHHIAISDDECDEPSEILAEIHTSESPLPTGPRHSV